MKGITVIGARLLQTAFVLLAVITILFFMFRLMPGAFLR